MTPVERRFRLATKLPGQRKGHGTTGIAIPAYESAFSRKEIALSSIPHASERISCSRRRTWADQSWTDPVNASLRDNALPSNSASCW
jgi:hypothetical protein